MANLSNIARPYARAAFDRARDTQQLAVWKAFLESAATIVKDPAMVRLLGNPELATKLNELFQEVLAPLLDTERKNFLHLLAQYRRLNVLPEISEKFNTYYASLEKISQVRVITAVEAQEEFKLKLTQSLKKRIQTDVTLHCEIDPAIIGGAIIHIGDRVIDGSIRGKLSRLLQNITG